MAIGISYSENVGVIYLGCKSDGRNNSLLFYETEATFEKAVTVCTEYNGSVLTIFDLKLCST